MERRKGRNKIEKRNRGGGGEGRKKGGKEEEGRDGGREGRKKGKKDV